MKPKVTLLAVTKPVVDFLHDPEDIIEYSGRWDYGEKSISKMGDRAIIGRWIASGEESMLEMVDAVFLVECSRVVTHELVRHRIASYQQESQRFVEYREGEDLFFVPPGLTEDQQYAYDTAMRMAMSTYRNLRDEGIKKQIARYVLPNSMRTRIVVKMNLREWRHVLRLRLHTSAQPEMREVMGLILAELLEQFPSVFEPLEREIESGKRSSR